MIKMLVVVRMRALERTISTTSTLPSNDPNNKRPLHVAMEILMAILTFGGRRYNMVLAEKIRKDLLEDDNDGDNNDANREKKSFLTIFSSWKQ